MATQPGFFSAQTWAIGLLAAVALVLLCLVVMGLRNRTIAKLGVRNIPRRRSQSALIILGLTLSTIIIVSALSIGDTLSYSVRRHAINAYGTIDQVISPPLLSALAGFVTSAADGEEPTDPVVVVASTTGSVGLSPSAALVTNPASAERRGGEITWSMVP